MADGSTRTVGAATPPPVPWPAAPQPVEPPGGATRVRLAALSFLMLFVELALIRWTAANNIHLAYLTNFVLLGSFLGIGAGFLRRDSSRELLGWTPIALAALVGFVLLFPVRLTTFTGGHELEGAFGMAPLPKWIGLPVIFLLAVTTMTCIADGVARLFRRFPPLDAYRLDIGGSIVGIAVFSGLAFLELPPVGWGTVAAAAIVVLLGRRIRWWQLLGSVAVVALLGIESFGGHDHWSPYYKVTSTYTPGRTVVANTPTHGVVTISANNIPHQTAYPVATLRRIERFYFFPYRHVSRSSLHEVLVIGAGNGNDVTIALAQGARRVDAVEIDPQLQRLGRRYHPDRPYADPRVRVHIDDGRAFLERTGKRYDLILMALPDSLTLLAGQSQLRLENFLFTIEAMRTARDHLAAGGTFAMYNYYEPFLLDRYAGELAAVFGQPPCVELGDSLADRSQAVLTSRLDGPTPRCARRWHGRRLEAATDDHPFPYLPTREIPTFYLKWLLFIVLVSALVVRGAAGSLRPMVRYLDLACMGAAFLLLETKNVVQFALLFGTTWFVNSLVFAGVLLSVLAAIEIAKRVRLPRPLPLYGALLATLALAWIVPQHTLLDISPLPRFIAATTLAFAPIFLANLVFAQRFRSVGSSTTAFGANLLGAMLGGVLEYVALVSGYRFLLIVIGALYAVAFLAGRRALAAHSSGAPA